MAKILLVEDDTDNRVIYRVILEHSGHEVIETWNGEDGVRLAREAHPDLVLMDISIPLLDGYEATRRLKVDPGTAHILIVALTAHAMAEDRVQAAEAGFDAYLTKPLEPRRLAEEVRRLLSSPRR